MKRVGNLYDAIADQENLRLAFWKARKAKGGKADVEEFRNNLERNLADLRDDLLNERVVWGPYHRFTIHDPKERVICAAPFRDRVLHHAMMNRCEPVFERYQIHDSYACRKGKGLHAALDRAVYFTRRYRWYLKLDIRKYFDSISHEVVMRHLNRRFKDTRLLRLFYTLLASYETEPGRGIPIGNLTSQFVANDYLAALDHLIKEALRIPGYLRYMDDFILWHDEPTALKSALAAIRDSCQSDLALALKPPVLNQTRHGISMLGYRVLPTTVKLARRSRHRFSRKLKGYWYHLQEGGWNQDDFAGHVLPLTSYAAHARSTGFRLSVMEAIGCSPQARTA